MVKSKLMTNNQGLETARLARNAGVLREVYQGTLDDGTINNFLNGLVPEKQLVLHGTVLIPANPNDFDPYESLINRPDTWWLGACPDKIQSVVKKIKITPSVKFTSFRVVEESGNGIAGRAELPKNYVHEDPSKFCAHLASMIDRQPDGKEGDLLTDGCANFFYVRGVDREVFSVSVHWKDYYQKWEVYVYQLSYHGWRIGHRVFSSE